MNTTMNPSNQAEQDSLLGYSASPLYVGKALTGSQEGVATMAASKLLEAIFGEPSPEQAAYNAALAASKRRGYNATVAAVEKRPHTHYGDKGQPLWWVSHGVNDHEGQGYYTREGEKYLGIAADPSTSEEIRPYETPKLGQWLVQYRGERGDWKGPNTEEPMSLEEAQEQAEEAALAAKIEAARAAKAASKAAKAALKAEEASPFAALAALKGNLKEKK